MAVMFSKSKRVLALLLVIVTVVTFSACSKKPSGDELMVKDFINCNWGWSRAKVAKTEPNEYDYANDELLLYVGEMNGTPADIYYIFEDDALVAGEVHFYYKESILSDIISSYVDLRQTISEQYGEPLDDDYRVFIDNDPKVSGDSDNNLIYYQQMKYVTEWETEKSNMSLTLDYADEQINYLFKVEKAA